MNPLDEVICFLHARRSTVSSELSMYIALIIPVVYANPVGSHGPTVRRRRATQHLCINIAEAPVSSSAMYGTALAIVAIYATTNNLPISLRPHRTALRAGLLTTFPLFTFDMRAIALAGIIMPAYVLAYAVEHITTMPPVARQLPAGLSSAREYLSSCGEFCTDAIQSKYQSARLDINPDDQYCNNYGNTPGEGGCYCGNYLRDGRAVSSLSACIVNTCTKASKEVLDFIDVTGEFIPQMTGQLNLLCPNSINALAFTGGVQPPSSTNSVSTTVTSSSTSKSTSSSSSATSSSSSSSTPTSTSTSASSTSTGSPTSSPGSAAKMPVLMDSVYLATTLCGVIMAVTVYML
ncbi:hypothetical protein DFS33DRAFT_651531 [Desarmillaria ectypa]|nr:hypothetical protein DFS33DRAFT_651531 [Desarmillaria ectypa]